MTAFSSPCAQARGTFIAAWRIMATVPMAVLPLPLGVSPFVAALTKADPLPVATQCAPEAEDTTTTAQSWPEIEARLGDSDREPVTVEFDALSCFLPEDPTSIGTAIENEECRTKAAAKIDALETSRTIELVAALEARFAALMEIVARLERRTSEVVAQLEHLSRAKSGLEDDIVNLQQQLKTQIDSARHDPEVLALDKRRSERGHSRLVSTVPGGAQPSVGRPSHQTQAIAGRLSAFAVLAAIAIRSLYGQAHIDSLSRVASRPALAASDSFLPSRPLSASSFAVPAIRANRFVRTTPTTEPVLNAPSTKETAPQFIGALTILSEPLGAAVFINQRGVGDTPLHVTQLRAGTHVVRVERQGYQRWTTAVLVSADQEARVNARLEPQR
jgi:hypothetical protein